MNEAPRAADLPEGSIVANRDKVWIKNHPSHYCPWRSSYGSHEYDVHVDQALADGATVLRHGYGEERS